MDSSDVLKAPPDSTNSDLANNIQDATDNDSGSAAQSNNSLSTSPSVSKSVLFRDPYLPEDDGSILTPEHAFVQYQTRSEDQACQICGQPAVGFHHRAYVCEACKVIEKPLLFRENVVITNDVRRF
ncbi:Nuclear receptor 2DBD gamma [Fasciolopsis buskii]|uniref:Nuclear receptor 2DBD gamma n=1 Tax=Fasciolopsis buskii TaxID=27845 RepID=A0A8E0RSB7_9TREM|nr:Nuclear receptor 2DBD gamma [Fasciolopsis buski]